jgi:phosphoribosyl 1,2-cyclic phosphodiesterase
VRVIPLQSGSSGNCCYVEAAGVRLLFDAGIGARRVADRLGAHGVDPARIDALIVSHEHSDHVGAAGALARRFGFPVHITEPTWRRSTRAFAAGDPLRHFTAGSTLRFASTLGEVRVETLPTPHDAVDGVVFVVDDGTHRLAVMTDFGHVFPALADALAGCDAAVLESNYDEDLLSGGPYPAFLKRRISGPGGHISNHDAAALLLSHGARLRWACLAHLSETNNSPDLALETVRAAVGPRLPLHVAARSACSAPLSL